MYNAGDIQIRALNSASGYREPVVYNSKVFASICRQVWQAEKLSPPLELATWARAYSEIYSKAVNGGYWKNLLKTGAWAGLGVAVSTADHRTFLLAFIFEILKGDHCTGS